VEVKRQARRAAQSGSPVLLLGETGTGKELLAHAIHAASRARGPFVSVNIAAVPETLLEAEFFGVAPGAYTGAERKGREGKFKLADGGTLFLDEIGDMPLALQAKLLRALQDGEIEPLGSNRLLPFDARIVAATSRDLPALVRGQFREDLYYRLNVLPACRAAARARRHPALVEVLGEDMARAAPAARADARRAGAAGRAALARQHPRAAQRAGAGRAARRIRPAGLARRAHAEAVLAPVSLAPLQPAPPPRRRPTTRPPCCNRWPSRCAHWSGAPSPRRCGHGGNKLAAARRLGISRATLYERLAAG
jgi:DNA-binding NtrC family response regulator